MPCVSFAGTVAVMEPSPTSSLLDGLNDRQREAVVHQGGPLLIVAGPGSGKTRVLTHRAAHLLDSGVSPYALLVVTFTNKAAGELVDRLALLAGEGVKRLWVSTFHSACARILRSDAPRVGLPPRFSIFDTQDSTKVLRQLLTTGGASPDSQELKSLRDEISRVKSQPYALEKLRSSSFAADHRFAETLAAYDAELRKLGAVDFDDLLTLAVQLLDSAPDVLERYQRRFEHVLVDEFQDTNAVQVRLVELLSAPQNNVCVVGDTQQSIYSWRGADPSVMHGFLDRYPSAHTVLLEQNYRSTEPILEVVRAIVEPVRDHLVPHLVAAGDTPGPPVRLYEASDDRDEAQFVVSEVASAPGSCALLLRTNAQSRVLEEALLNAGVSYQVVGALRFYDRAEVKDALSYLRLVVNPEDRMAFARCVNTPRRGLGEKAVAWILAEADRTGSDLVAAVRAAAADGATPGRLRAPLTQLSDLLAKVDAALDVSPAAALEQVSEAGLRAALEADRSNVDRAENLEELLASARQFVSRSSGLSGRELSLEFLENVALLSAADLEDEDAAGVTLQLLTVHAAKGREFERVYVVGVEDGYFPHQRARSDADRDEERRLLFVACSRAERQLTLSYARSRFLFNDRRDRSPSPFLESLPESVERVGGGRSRRFPSSSAPSGWRSHRPNPSPSVLASGPAGVGRVVAVPGPRISSEQAHLEVAVVHPRFGAGTIVGVEGDRVDVSFGATTRTLDLRFAPLELA